MQPQNKVHIINKIILGLAIVFIGSFIGFFAFEFSKNSIYGMNRERNRKLSVYIEAELEENYSDESGIQITRMNLYSGSGVVFWRTGYILTAAHFLDDGRFDKISVKTFGKQRTIYQAETLARDRDLDVMVIKIPHDFGSEVPISDNQKFRPWEETYTIGCPFGACNTYIKGNFITYGKSTDLSWLQNTLLFDMTMVSGSSGQGIFNKMGNLVSICSGNIIDQRSVAVGPQTNLIRKFLEKNRLPYRNAAGFW